MSGPKPRTSVPFGKRGWWQRLICARSVIEGLEEQSRAGPNTRHEAYFVDVEQITAGDLPLERISFSSYWASVSR